MTVSRRRFLSGAAAGAAGTALTAGVLAEGARVDAAAGGQPTATRVFPFHGEHQSGILTPVPAEKQNASCFAAFDVTAADRADLMKTLTVRARALTSGGPAPDLGVGAPPADSAVLGPEIPADGLTVTVGVGASLFDQRFGLADRKPAHLTPMRTFPDDSPDPVWMHGDLLVQLCADQPDTIHHAIRDITRHTRGALQLRWRIQGYNSPARPSGTGRNLLGFKDGTANPVGSAASDLIWVDSTDEPSWTKGGTYQVVRLIRMLVEFWDRVSIAEQENMFGRRRESGAPLDGTRESDIPDYAADPDATVTPADAHIRLANPRTPETDNQQLLRRSYNYDLGIDPNGNMSAGHIFTCFQQDIGRQFETIQTRLAGEPLTDYVQPFGGGYFFVVPGVRDAQDWYGRTLLS
ncbi:iron uptake transporter deferrochelatase/peroxidase subunit [Nocardia seriolae]|uniref:Deferrochelatase n=1 Tax=Nocardia seriolae TaxID=37332 RepID=A0ABC8AQB1_9NOCA|nr:iron uptake transporter deferrochelatase/peroxidase subunit [Nocardia seriolae]APA96386.1 Deferrochelatase/peroxidase EfeB [Nocardia seriolae]MTJ61458.1 deferrochelatase/peroxidase EfeB [Nocardia seriolae]MTJ71689.1 deferrochelatase/peroxidase EfeB [Nocardia seriolae]MTJ86490.1 deferrochelatase/peroxidase EfeB [Nocardia seriolae]MTK30484.1 deferrochelatase/peroxidase EfeB [Nocardia seriolae]